MIWKRYRCIPPSDYDTVKVHIQQNSLNGAKGFSILSLAGECSQVPVTENGRNKTDFCRPFELFKLNQMALGLGMEQSAFQCLIECIFRCQN